MSLSPHSHTNIHRIRHLRHISVRRIASQEIVTTYFTLNSYAHTSKCFYTSEKQQRTRNPTFRDISTDQFNSDVDQSSSYFIFRLWATSSRKYTSDRVVLEWIINMNKLAPIENHRLGIINLPNMVIIGLTKPFKNNIYFTSSDFTEILKPSKLIDSAVTIQTPEISYNFNTLKTIISLTTSSQKERQIVKKAKNSISEILEKQIIFAKELETLRTNISVLKKRKLSLKQILTKDREILNTFKGQTNSTVRCLSHQTKELELSKTNLRTKHDLYMTRKELLLSGLYDITFRRLTLIKDIGFIYEIYIPASESGDKSKDKTNIDLPTISDIHLPPQSTILSSNVTDMDISTSLGFVTHLVQCISTYLLLPLRFPVYFFSSQSLVINDNNESYIDEFRELPLFLKRRNDLSIHRVEQGFFLLNHNIMQIRQHLGLSTPLPRQTLKNLFNLFEETANALHRLKQTRRSSMNLLTQFNQANSNINDQKLLPYIDMSTLPLELEDDTDKTPDT